jgi:hypothetical protein
MIGSRMHASPKPPDSEGTESGEDHVYAVGSGVVSSDEMSFSARALLEDPQTLSSWLRAELLGYLRCPEDVRDAVRGRLREDPSFTDWCVLLDELEAGGEAMRQDIRELLEATTSAVP